VAALVDGKDFRARRQIAGLLVLVQEFAHLINRQRRVLPIERFLTLALLPKLTLTSECSTGDF
jgi:hypothetical protein